MARTPPRFVPTLTEVVTAGSASTAPASLGPWSQEQLIHRVMQRIDLSLDRRLREAIATILLEQTRTVGPLLRDEIESVVRQTVAQAFEEEMNAGIRSVPPAS